eukprot:7397087-Alexandrium_andersonii.AAC.1
MPRKSVATLRGLRVLGAPSGRGRAVGSGTDGGWLGAASEPMASGLRPSSGPCAALSAAGVGGPSQLQSAAPRLQTTRRAA